MKERMGQKKSRVESQVSCFQKVSQENSFLLLAFLLGLYLTFGMILFPRFKYVINADAISYISVARKYLTSNWREAINAYWGPLISWLLLPFLLIISEPLQAARLLNFLLSSLLLAGLWLLSSRFKISLLWRTLLALVYFPLGYYFAYSPFTPDLLVVLILVFYFYFLFDHEYHLSAKKAFVCGLLGSLAYLAKSYNFFFFLFHFPTFHLLSFFRKKGSASFRLPARQMIGGLVVFLIISSLWLGTLRYKYGYFTLSTAGSRAWTLIAPDSRGETLNWIGLIPPPDRLSLSAWEDPSLFPVNLWNPFASWFNFNYFLNHVCRNARSFLVIILNQSPLYFLILISFVILFFWNYFKNRHLHRLSFHLLFAFFIYPAGFLFLFYQERYVWINFIILFLMTGILFSWASERWKRAKVLLVLCFLLISLSFAIVPGRYLIRDYDRLASGFSGKKIYEVAQALKKINLKGHIATNDYWCETLILTYYTGSRYFGKIRENMSATELKEELERYRIKYFFLWGEGPDELKLRPLSVEMMRFKDIRLRVLRLIN